MLSCLRREYCVYQVTLQGFNNQYVSAQVCGVGDKRADNVWLAAEGIYLPVTETK